MIDTKPRSAYLFTFFVVRSTKSACISGNVHSANHSHSLSLFERQVWKRLCYIYRIYIALYPPLVPWNRGFAVCSLQLSAWWGALCLQCRTAKLYVIMSGLNGSLPTATPTYKILISINLYIKESVQRAMWPRRSNIPHLHVQLQSDDLCEPFFFRWLPDRWPTRFSIFLNSLSLFYSPFNFILF